jgi:acyl dehydratase
MSYTQRSFDDVVVGETLPGFTYPVTFTRVAAALAATLDFFPVHHDRDYANQQGHPDILLSTIQIMGLVDRAATEWAGPLTFIEQRDLRLRAPIYPGSELTATGRVTSKSHVSSPDDPRLVHVTVGLVDQQGVLCSEADLRLRFPSDVTTDGR